MELADLNPQLVSHVYWEQKEQFLLTQDTYLTWILFAVEAGQFHYQIEKDEGLAGPGDFVLCPPHIAFHRMVVSPLSFHSITFNFPMQQDQSIHNLLQRRNFPIPLTPRLLENFSHLKLDHPSQRYSMSSFTWKQHYFLDIWLMLMETHSQHFGMVTLEKNDPLMQQIAFHLEEYAHQPLELKKVATDHGLTPVQLIRRFKSVYQMKPLQYLTSIRVKRACTLLLETDWNLDTIATQCGYENGFYLSRLFSKHMGESPSSYRKNHQV